MNIFIYLCLFYSFLSFSANEERNLLILKNNGSSKIHSTDLKLNGKLLSTELASSFEEKNKQKATIENNCESPRVITNEERNEEISFEDCLLTIRKKKRDSVVIQYQVKTKIKDGKSKSFLRKKMLKANYL